METEKYTTRGAETLHQEPREYFAVGYVVDALHEARIPSDELLILAEVMRSGLGLDGLWGDIKRLRAMGGKDWSVDAPDVQRLIESAKQSLGETYVTSAEGIASELNNILRTRLEQLAVGSTASERVQTFRVQYDETGYATLQVRSNEENIYELSDIMLDGRNLPSSEQQAIASYENPPETEGEPEL